MQSNILADMFSLSSSADRYKKMYSGRNGDQLVDEASISCSICYDYDYSAIIRYLEHFNLWDAEGGVDIVIQTDEDCRKMEEFISSYGERVSFDGAFCVVDAASGEVSQAQADPDAIQFLFLQKYPPPEDDALVPAEYRGRHVFYIKYYIATQYTPYDPGEGISLPHWFVRTECNMINMVLQEIIARAGLSKASVTAKHSDIDNCLNDFNDKMSSFAHKRRFAYTGKFGECTVAEIVISDAPSLEVSSVQVAFVPTSSRSLNNMLFKAISGDAIPINGCKAYFGYIDCSKVGRMDLWNVLPTKMFNEYSGKAIIFALDPIRSADFIESTKQQLMNTHATVGQQALYENAKALVTGIVSQLTQYL